MANLLAEKFGPQVTSFEIVDVPITNREQHILDTCKNGQIQALELIFSASGVVAPAPAITTHNKSSHVLPCTHEMVEAAVLGEQPATVEHIYKTFPEARVHGPELVAAIELGDLHIFKLLAKQSQSKYDVIHKEFEDEETSLVKACKGTKPHIAYFLLDEGADPNYSGSSGDLGAMDGPLANAVLEQELELIQKLIHKGAVVEDFHVQYAVERNRAHIVRYLINQTDVKADLELALMKSRSEGCEAVEAVLVKRISNGPEAESEHESGLHATWHRMKEHLHHSKVTSH
jgi:hypothetical protein